MAHLMEISRYMLIMLTDLSALYVFLCLMLKKKRSAKIMIIYYSVKTLIVNVVMAQIYVDQIMADPFWDKIYLTIVIITAVSQYAVLCYTFQGSFAKVALVSILCDAAASLIGIGLIFLTNVLKGRTELLSYLGKIQWQDGIIPVGMCLICILIYKMCGNQLKRVRDYELKHKKLWMFLSLLWIGSALITMLPEYNRTFKMTVIIITIGAMIFAAAAIILGIYLWRSWHRQVLRMHNYLTKQRELMRLHNEAVRHQIELMERHQAEIDEQMQKLSEMEDLSEKKRTAFEYLEKLKAQYGAIRAVAYSDDYMLNSALYSYAGIFEKQGVTPEFSFGTYRRGCLKEEDLTEVLMILLETASAEIEKADPENRFLRLQGGTVKNQVIFRMECACGNEKTRSLGKGRASAGLGMLKRRVKKLGGKTKVSRKGACVLTEVLMDGE